MNVQLDHLTQPVRLGRGPRKKDARTLRLAKYLTPALPQSPDSVDNFAKMSWPSGVMLNDRLGCCTCSALGHICQLWTALAGAEVTVPDSAILTAYEQACGYNPADSSTDQGGVEADVLAYFRKIGVAGFKADAFVSVQLQNREHIKAAINLFGGLYIGLDLPQSIRSQGYTWSVDLAQGQNAAPGSLGGHAVVIGAYDAAGVTADSWGEKYKLTWDFLDVYCEEAWAVLWPADQPGMPQPAGLDYAALQADLQAVMA